VNLKSKTELFPEKLTSLLNSLYYFWLGTLAE